MENPTRNKLHEAEYFLDQMKVVYQRHDEFRWNLSAFLSAARSITFYMQKQYKRQKGFAEWYCQKQTKMMADPELVYLNKARVEALKKEPVLTVAAMKDQFIMDAYLVKEGEPIPEKVRKVKPKPPVQSGPTTVRRFFPKFRDIDILDYSKNQLDKLAKIVDECEQRFR